MDKKFISASMMCSKLIDLKEIIQIFEKEKVDYLHIDVMDGEFVPNLGLGTDYIRGLRELTNIPLDIHLMTNKPEEKISWLNLSQQDIVSIHYESTPHVQKAIMEAKKFGCKVFLAINPATPIFSIEEVLEYIDGINVLTVNPGFAGQKIVHSCISKTGRLKKFLEEYECGNKIIEVDGNISNENSKILSNLGANMFVAGTSSIFCYDTGEMSSRIRMFRDSIKNNN